MSAGRGGRVWAQAPFLSVLAVLLAAFVYLMVEPGHWRRGTAAFAAAFAYAGVLRLVLSNASAGLLAVRARWIDLVCYFLIAATVITVDLRIH
jgi:hypothetical protein